VAFFLLSLAMGILMRRRELYLERFQHCTRTTNMKPRFGRRHFLLFNQSPNFQQFLTNIGRIFYQRFGPW